MPQRLSSKQVAEAALRQIGEYSINDSAAAPEALSEALFWLDTVVSSFVAKRACYWLRPATYSFSLTANTRSYDLDTALGTNAPEDGVFILSEAWVRDNGRDVPVDIITRSDYEGLSNKSASGKPDRIYVDRLADPQVYVYPVPGTGTSYSLRLLTQNYAPDMTKQQGKLSTGIPPEWNEFLILSVAARIGNGPVRRLPVNEVRNLYDLAGRLERDLDAYANRERPLSGVTARAG